jgi:hypothetical protein
MKIRNTDTLTTSLCSQLKRIIVVQQATFCQCYLVECLLRRQVNCQV